MVDGKAIADEIVESTMQIKHRVAYRSGTMFYFVRKMTESKHFCRIVV